ncbi:MAG: hypothetical protein AB1831_02455 [Pseudomonadota bacterium]
MKKLSYVLLVLGLLLGPAYWIHAKFYTGSEAMLLALAPTPAETGKQGVWRSPEFSLRGEMAPVGLVLLAEGHFSPNMDENRPPKDLYTATLHRAGEAAKPLGFALGVKHVGDSNPAFREHLLLMHKVQPGQYRLEVTPASQPAIQIDRMQLQVRQNLSEPDPNVVTGGIVLFILGVLGLVMG